MFHKVIAAKPLQDFHLLISFENGELKTYNVGQLIDEWEHFKVLSAIAGMFQQVKVDVGGYGISWNDDADLSCNELYRNGVAVDWQIHSLDCGGRH
ncbi:MAG: DUF2442 domain-containing protein [Polyangiaceae bacterium]|nr:DUF2442 domain-containing protein [Polyangiaceae bacterium]